MSALTGRRSDDSGCTPVGIGRNRFLRGYAGGETIFVLAGDGNDVVVLDDSARDWWTAEFHGEAGDDVLIGVNPADDLRGGPGDDTLVSPFGQVRGLPEVRFVHQVYRELLGRPADEDGARAFGEALSGGMDETLLDALILASAEFFDRR
jgi:Ca2+-binding RTX toxin-like protein